MRSLTSWKNSIRLPRHPPEKYSRFPCAGPCCATWTCLTTVSMEVYKLPLIASRRCVCCSNFGSRARQVICTKTSGTSDATTAESPSLFTGCLLEQIALLRKVSPSMFRANQDTNRSQQDKIPDRPGQNPGTSGQNSVLTPSRHFTKFTSSIVTIECHRRLARQCLNQ